MLCWQVPLPWPARVRKRQAAPAQAGYVSPLPSPLRHTRCFGRQRLGWRTRQRRPTCPPCAQCLACVSWCAYFLRRFEEPHDLSFRRLCTSLWLIAGCMLQNLHQLRAAPAIAGVAAALSSWNWTTTWSFEREAEDATRRPPTKPLPLMLLLRREPRHPMNIFLPAAAQYSPCHAQAASTSSTTLSQVPLPACLRSALRVRPPKPKHLPLS